MKKKRILVVSHGHPDFSLGGAEVAAYNLFKAYLEHELVENAWFLARADKGKGATGAISIHRENEYLWEQSVNDYFYMKPANPEAVAVKFVDFIKAIKPNIVHIHHYVHFGLDIFRLIKSVDDNIKIIFTLHEYIAICANNGQMIKNNSQMQLCNGSSLEECRRCFPERSAEDFWMRKHLYIRNFDLVDNFVAPSEFLKGRYVEWGIDKEKIKVIENGQIPQTNRRPREVFKGERRNRFGFFGQINKYKGLHVVLEALNSMDDNQKEKIIFEVHGANLEFQSADFQEKIKKLSGKLIEEGVLRWMGSYQPNDLRARMQGVDWVVVPSVWWENSPMVIQESFACGRPVLASDLGGMREKINHGYNGFRVPHANSNEWKNALLKAAEMKDVDYCRMQNSISIPFSHYECASEHINLD